MPELLHYLTLSEVRDDSAQGHIASTLRSVIVGVTMAVLLALGWSASARAAALEQPIGISDNKPETFGDPRFAELGIRHARLITPYDSAITEPQRLAEWLDAARRAGVEVHVALDRRRGDNCPSSPCHLPSPEEYASGFAAFRRAHPDILSFTPWNEANHPTQPTRDAPERAAEYYNIVAAACAGCTVVAADVIGFDDGMLSWLERYRASLQSSPTVWGMHNYGDVIEGTTRYLDAFLGAVDGDVWLTETGGIVLLEGRDGRPGLPYDEARSRNALSNLLDLLSKRTARVKRAYVYHWQASSDSNFDSGIIRPNGTARPGYDVLHRALVPGSKLRIGPVRGRAASVRPVKGRAVVGRGRSSFASFDRTIRRSRRGLSLGIRCKGATRCRGQMHFRIGRGLWRGKFNLRPNFRRSIRVRRLPGLRPLSLSSRGRTRVRVYARIGKNVTRGSARLAARGTTSGSGRRHRRP